MQDLLASSAPAASPHPVVLTVCTGNVCRSPLAEALLRTHLSDLELRVHSAGTHALVGQPMTHPAQQLAQDRNVDPTVLSTHRARLLSEPLLGDADLVLTMTAEQRNVAVRMLPRSVDRIFPVREFARLTEALTDATIRAAAATAGRHPRARLVAVVEMVSHRRGGPVRASDDVVDPYRRPFSVYEQSAAQLTPALADVERVIRAALA
ncbi:low molecular weight phosphatase family protein [uncultured Microbacterium sp.]|uniref:arsenate reductase/protein-tyrosine-phosphatase family protein n=1 Tax=uncultured Microbacterium sp. TaxID=191216 RepID=UPI00262E700A|nr:low molecular weight phosphatase family protein [uncultured Microbacterium sp.]